jgi:GTP-binding protein
METAMKIHRADYIKSAPALKDCPDFGDRSEVALVGRSNVGKSSFINSLTYRKNLARTSNTPGKTRYLNFYNVGYVRSDSSPLEEMLFVDLPGYGYAKVSKTEQEQWRKNFEHYLANRDNIQLVVQLIDSRHGPQESDIQMFEWLQFHGKRVLVVLTKMDKLSRSEMNKHMATTARALDVASADLIGFSAETHMGRDLAWKAIQTVLDQAPIPVIDFDEESPEEAV